MPSGNVLPIHHHGLVLVLPCAVPIFMLVVFSPAASSRAVILLFTLLLAQHGFCWFGSAYGAMPGHKSLTYRVSVAMGALSGETGTWDSRAVMASQVPLAMGRGL